MSYATVYKILPDGDVVGYEDVRNAMAGAMYMWRKLGEKMGVSPIYGREEEVWGALGSGRFTLDEDICLAFTFDGAYVQAKNIPRLITALEAFHATYCQGIAPTIKGIAEALTRLIREEPEIRGACFQQTSASDHPWSFYNPETDESRPFNFDRHEKNNYGQKPYDLVDSAISSRSEAKVV